MPQQMTNKQKLDGTHRLGGAGLKISAVSMLIRSATLASQLILMLYLAQYIGAEGLGVFGLMSGAIAISLPILGWEFHSYSSRAILATEPPNRAQLIKNQGAFYGFTYLFFLPALTLPFFAGLLSWELVGWFYLLIVLQHWSQEGFRLLMILSMPIRSNLVLFLRNGIWVYFVVGVAVILGVWQSLLPIWIGWSLGSVAALIVCARSLARLSWDRAVSVPIDWLWIKTGAYRSLPFLGIAFCLMALMYTDRYFIQYYYGEKDVGVYTFYSNISRALHVIVFSGVTMIWYPPMVQAFQGANFSAYRNILRKMTVRVSVMIIVFSAIFCGAIWVIVEQIGEPIYKDNLAIFWVLLFAAAAQTLGDIPHFALYSRRRDLALFLSALCTLILSVMLNMLLVPDYGIQGAAASAAISWLFLLMLRLTIVVWIGKLKPQ